MYERQPRYRATCRDQGYRVVDGYDDFAGQFDQIRAALAVRDEGTVPCNNDLLAENFIDDGDRIWLIDYEYSGNNDPCFELGNTWTECELGIDQLDELVTAYYGRRRPEKIARAHLQAIVSQYGWALWGFIQQAVSPLEFDFWGWGMERFEGAVEEMRAPGFAAAARRRRRRETVAEHGETPRPRARRRSSAAASSARASPTTSRSSGWEDVVLLEQGQLSSGTTWHAAGLVGQLRASESGTRLVQYSVELYAALEEETGLSAGYKQCGGVTVARTPERMVQLRRTAATADAFGMECVLLTPEEALERYPVMQVDDLEGAIWLPGDGKANPTDLTNALAKGARNRGARVFEHTRVTGVSTDRGRVTGVSYDAADGTGEIEAEYVVNCAGQWAKAVGAMVGVTVPLHSAEHFYVVTEPFDGVHPDLPVLRDPDGYTYFKEEVGGLVVGGFEPEAKPWVSPHELPHPFEFQLLEEDWEHFSILMDNAILRVPVLERTGIRKFYNGPESFTPDNQFILGEAPEVANFFVGAGFNSVGIASAGWRRPRAGRVDRGGGADQRPDQRGHPPVRAVQRQRALAARPRGGGARPALRDPVAQPRDAHGAAVPPLAGAPPAGRGERQLRQPDGLGAGQLLRPCWGVADDRLLLGQAELAALVGCRADQHPHRASRSSTRRRSRSTSSAARTPARPCSGCAPPTSTCPSGGRSTRGCSTHAGPTSPT